MLNNIQNVANTVASNLDTAAYTLAVVYMGRNIIPAAACKMGAAVLNLANQKDKADDLNKTSSYLFKKATASLGRDLTVAGSIAVVGFAGKTVNDKLFPEVKDDSYYTAYVTPVVNFGYAAKDVVADNYGKIVIGVGAYAVEEIGRKMIANKAGADYKNYGTYAHTAAFNAVTSGLSTAVSTIKDPVGSFFGAKEKVVGVFAKCCVPKDAVNVLANDGSVTNGVTKT